LEIAPILHSQLVQLCSHGFIERGALGDDALSLSRLLDELHIAYSKTEQRVEIGSTLELIDVNSIQAELADSRLLDGFAWQYQLMTESTNADALKIFAPSRQPCIVLAEMQTGGRGRRGRQWISPFGKNIYCTIGLHKSIQGSHAGLLSIVSGIALCKALTNCGVNGVRLKWPNDLYYQNQKLGGILIESSLRDTGEYFFAIGFGINVSMGKLDFGVIPQPATSLNLISGVPVSRDLVLQQAIRQVVQMIDEFDESAISRVVDAFDAIDAFRHQPITVTTPQHSIDGVNAGINSAGQLLLDTDQGQLEFSAADISVRGR